MSKVGKAVIFSDNATPSAEPLFLPFGAPEAANPVAAYREKIANPITMYGLPTGVPLRAGGHLTHFCPPGKGRHRRYA